MDTNQKNPSSQRMAELPYDAPREGHNFWVFDNIMPNAGEIRARCLAKTDWIPGYPHADESWPGHRAIPALLPAELNHIQAHVCGATGATRLWTMIAPDGARLNHNCVQVVAGNECQSRPHTDSRRMCRYAAVLYLTPFAPANSGTSFYRQKLPDGRAGGNQVVEPHANLVEALGTRFVPHDSFVEDRRIENRFNRLLLYSACMIHSATSYFGLDLIDSRMAAVFFWMA